MPDDSRKWIIRLLLINAQFYIMYHYKIYIYISSNMHWVIFKLTQRGVKKRGTTTKVN